MDALIVSMFCGQSGRPFRVVFESAGPGARYTIREVSEGSGITVTPVTGTQLLPSGGQQPSTVDPALIDANALDWRRLRCPFCPMLGGAVRCRSCNSLLCFSAALPEDRRLAFLCPICASKSRHIGLSFLGRVAAGRFRRRPRPLQLQAKDVAKLSEPQGLLGAARRLLPGPKRDQRQ